MIKKLLTYGLAASALATTPNVEAKPMISYSVENAYRTSGGSTLVDGPFTTISISDKWESIDAFIWGGFNVESGKFNEIDIGIGYNHDNWRVGLAKWIYTEEGGGNVLTTIDFNKKDFLDTRLDIEANIAQFLDEKGTNPSIKISKTFEKENMSLTPYFKIAATQDFFGSTAWPSNLVYGINCEIKNVPVSFFYEKHDGKNTKTDKEHYGIKGNLKF